MIKQAIKETKESRLPLRYITSHISFLQLGFTLQYLATSCECEYWVEDTHDR